MYIYIYNIVVTDFSLCSFSSNVGKRSESSSHKKQIDNLKEKDPEFYKFLQENDEGLLDFSASEESDQESGDEGEKRFY